jgi:hypothetical protein
VPTPGTGGTLEGRVNRGADGTVPRTESPIIGRDGRTTHIDDPATGLRREPPPSGVTGTTNTNGSTNEWRRGRAVDGGSLRRGGDTTQTPSGETHTTPVDRNRGNNDSGLRRGDAPATGGESTPKPAPSTDSWRGRTIGRRDDAGASPAPSAGSGGSDVPRRIIDGTAGARIRGTSPSGDSTPTPAPRSSEPRREYVPRESSGRSTERSSPPPHVERSSPPPSQSHSEPSHNSPPPQSHDTGSKNDGGSGHVKRGD